ncbi:MAG: sensor histidine kinase [Planctomycetaceae bacterium]|nr:sensor histidine kinase [Planctomycetaceae bacterium]
MNESEQILQLRRENEQLRQQLLATQKLSSLGELLSTTTHEFNNVLMTIINYAKIGLRHTDKETRDKSLQKILAAGERASRITNSVLGMARNRANRFEATSLQNLIEETLILLEREMSKYRISIDREFSAVPDVFANGNQIQQVILNLMINARQAMPDGGTLLLGLSHDDKLGMVDLMVRDTGSGIPREKLPRIFDSFFTTKNGPDESGKGGTGLGLAACRNIIDTHQGRIRVESTVGRGTAFTIKLPVFQSAQADPLLSSGLHHPEQSV